MSTAFTQPPQHSAFGKYKRWLRLSLYTILLLAGQCTATLLGRFYFDKGGKSKWIATASLSCGFPILIPLLIYSAKSTNHDSSKTKTKTEPRSSVMIPLYLGFGLLLAVMDFLYSYGLSCLPLSTFALVCATQLVFNAIATFLLNSQKFTALILNSIVVLTMSVVLVALNTESEDKNLPKEKQLIGIFCALAASAMFALHHALLQLYFVKIAKTEETYLSLLRMNFYPMLIASVAGLGGLFGSGDWRSMGREMKEFKYGGVSYVMTLVWTAVTWQIACIGMLGLIFEASSLFSVVIGNLELTITPILAVFVFHDKIYGMKVISFLLAIWGLLSYIYQYYLDAQKANQDKIDDGLGLSKV
ncbi:probable purine permease 10 [Vigna umbellata]|uniref:probable purine permease 10 n=1 Tax=Vigna umbellata TaxID=87088 RepID=UPI001F5F5D4D|nr:probable purine permease 10 [Vigna umbellata]